LHHSIDILDAHFERVACDAEERAHGGARTDAEVQRHAEVALHVCLVHVADDVFWGKGGGSEEGYVEGVALGGGGKLEKCMCMCVCGRKGGVCTYAGEFGVCALHELEAVLGSEGACSVDGLVCAGVVGVGGSEKAALIDEVVASAFFGEVGFGFEVFVFRDGLEAVGVVEGVFGVERSFDLGVDAAVC
jgi:hypothetical protein